ncbi:hypothetical protein B1748_09000 [Paenibacillus sp. MY03]|nr:hypothetical protein B1748_09000 [Paenibacillus sp. MY03]
MEGAAVVYETMRGWRTDISSARSFAELPTEAQVYVLRIEELVGVPVRYISVGPRREQLIDRGQR